MTVRLHRNLFEVPTLFFSPLDLSSYVRLHLQSLYPFLFSYEIISDAFVLKEIKHRTKNVHFSSAIFERILLVRFLFNNIEPFVLFENVKLRTTTNHDSKAALNSQTSAILNYYFAIIIYHYYHYSLL